MTIYLTENNAGGLMIGNATVGWWDVTGAQAIASFAEDADAIATDNTDDWTASHYEINPDLLNTVASWKDGVVVVEGRYGRAAQSYLRKTDEEAELQE